MYAQTCKSCSAERFIQCKKNPCTYSFPKRSNAARKAKEMKIIDDQDTIYSSKKSPLPRFTDNTMIYLNLNELIDLMCNPSASALKNYTDRGIDVNSIGFEEDKLILWACKYSCRNMVKALLQSGANPMSRCTRHGMTALYYAIKTGCVHIVKMLVDEGCNVNGLVKGHSYLYYAVEARQPQIVKFLLHYGADVNRRYFNGKTVLQDACRLGYLEIVELLLSHRARVDCKTKRTLSPLAYSVISHKPDVVQALVRNGADVYEEVGSRCFLLHVAASVGSVDSICLLLNQGHHIDTRTTLEETPLHLAVEAKNENVLNLLLNCGSNVNAINLKRQTPLHFAVEFDWPEAIYELLVKGADPSIRDRKSMSPLALAANLGKANCIEPLLTYGAELDELEPDAHLIPAVVRNIARYFVKRSAAGLNTDATKGRSIAFNDDDQDFEKSCAEEIDRMKRTYLYEELSFFNFLHGSKRVLVICASVADICTRFQNSLSRRMLHMDFPLYANMLERNFSIGMRCKPFYAEAMQNLNAASGFGLPLLPLERILGFLDVDGMRKLVDCK